MNKEKKNLSSDDKSAKQRTVSFRFIAQIALIILLVGIIIASILIFIPLGGKEYTDLRVLTYNEINDIYETDNYPTSVIYNQTEGVSENITLFFSVENYHRLAKFYEVRLKISLSSLIIDEETYGNETSTFFYKDHWSNKVLAKDQQWGPNQQTDVTFNFNSTIITHVGYDMAGYNLIFELWEFSSSENDFVYSGIFDYLTNFLLILVS